MSLSKNLLIRSRRRCYWCKNYTCTCILQIDQHSNVNITQDFFPIRLISYYSRLCWRPILATAVWDINTRRRHVIVKKSVCKQSSQSILVQKLYILLHSAQLQTYLGFVSTTIWILLMLFSVLVHLSMSQCYYCYALQVHSTIHTWKHIHWKLSIDFMPK